MTAQDVEHAHLVRAPASNQLEYKVVEGTGAVPRAAAESSRSLPALERLLPENQDGAEVEGGCSSNRRLVRNRSAPAGPHPYLDRFASGMHRPYEGDDQAWRKACIQPVPIPNLFHTGIRMKFSPGAGDGFTPDGSMTDNFRTGIHDVMRNLTRAELLDARDMRTRDYACAIRRHRADSTGSGGGESLCNTHMMSLELGSAQGIHPGGAGGGRASAGDEDDGLSLRQSKSLGALPLHRGVGAHPLSPLSAIRCPSSGLDRQTLSTLAEERQALMQREMAKVKLATAAAAAVSEQGEEGVTVSNCLQGAAIAKPSATIRLENSRRHHKGKALGWAPHGGPCTGRERIDGEDRTADSHHIRRRVCQGSALRRDEDYVSASNRRSRKTHVSRGSLLWDREETRGAAAGAIKCPLLGDECDVDFGAQASDATRRSWESERARRRRRKRRIRADGTDSQQHQKPASPPSRSRTPLATRCRHAPSGTLSAHRRRRLRKPFSSDSMLACLLDMRYGNTRDLSPRRQRGWDVTALPPGMRAEFAAASE